MRLLITGGAGLLGTPLAHRLRERHEVLAVDIDEMDITDRAAVAATLGEFRPNRVLHLAAWTDVDGCEQDEGRAEAVNADGTRNVAEACADLGAGLLYVSTDYVFDGSKDGAYVETDPVGPISAYGRSKLAGEGHVRALVPTHWITRCQSIYGARRRSFVDAVLARARSGEPLRVVTDQRVSPTWAEDLADALAAVVETASPGLYHVANSGSCTWYECAQRALEFTGLGDTPLTPVSAAEFARPAPRPTNSAFDCERLARAIGAPLRGWDAALGAYLKSLAEEEDAR